MSSSAITETDKDEKERAATINVVLKELKFSSPAPVRVGDSSFPANGSNTNVSAASTGATTVTRKYDHNGDPI